MMQSAIFFAGDFVAADSSKHTCIVSAEANTKPAKLVSSNLLDRPFLSTSYSVRKELESVFPFIPQANLIYNP